ncbi:MAG: TolC family protein, partial [Proteobacteria bacterium]
SWVLATAIASGQVLPTVAFAQTPEASAPREAQRAASEKKASTQPAKAPTTGAAKGAEAAKPEGPTITLEGFLDEVRQGNQMYQAAALRTEGAELRSDEYKLLTRPNLIAGANYAKTKAEQPTLFAPTELTTKTYTLGVEQTTNFGLTAQLLWNVNQISNNLNIPGTPVLNDYTVSSPQLVLSQSLWRNFNGMEIRATKQLQEAQALSVKFQQTFEQIQIMANAETAYWQLALAREGIAATREVLALTERSQKWSSNRQRLALADRADLLQSNAALLGRQLELQSSIDAEKVAARTFNTMRGVNSDVVDGNLSSFDPTMIETLQVPARVEKRADVLARQQALRAAEATSKLGRARNRPTVNLTGTLGRNGLDPVTGTAIRESWGNDHPNYAIGFNARVPLDFGTLSDTVSGFKKEEVAAQVEYQRALFEQERTWNDLTNRFREASGRYKLALTMEKAQKEKVEYERSRHGRGRTTLYQVILFETDYANAQYSRIRAQTDILNVYAQL